MVLSIVSIMVAGGAYADSLNAHSSVKEIAARIAMMPPAWEFKSSEKRVLAIAIAREVRHLTPEYVAAAYRLNMRKQNDPLGFMETRERLTILNLILFDIEWATNILIIKNEKIYGSDADDGIVFQGDPVSQYVSLSEKGKFRKRMLLYGK